MYATSDAASGSSSTAATMVYTLSYSATHIYWGSKWFTFFFVVSNDDLWIYGFASQITLIVSDPSANLFEVYHLCGLTV